MSSYTKDTPWCTVDSEGIKYLDNLDYLNYLLEKAPEIIRSHDQLLIKFLYWDFKELKEAGLGPLYTMTIESQVNSLKRILSYTPLKDYKPNIFINIDDE